MTYTEEEMRSILGASQERGGFSFHHLLLLENAFDFGSLTLKDVIGPPRPGDVPRRDAAVGRRTPP